MGRFGISICRMRSDSGMYGLAAIGQQGSLPGKNKQLVYFLIFTVSDLESFSEGSKFIAVPISEIPCDMVSSV